IPTILAEGKGNLHSLRPFAQLAIDNLQQIRSKLRAVQTEVGPMLHAESAEGGDPKGFKQATERAIAALEAYQAWLQRDLDRMPSRAAVGRANYEFFLNQIALLPYTPEQLFAVSAQEWARAVSFEQYERVRNEGLPELKIAANLDDEIR